MKTLVLILLVICSQFTFAQDVTVVNVEVERSPENDGSTDRAPIDEGGGPGKGEGTQRTALVRLLEEASEDKPIKVKINTLDSLKLRDGKAIKTSQIAEVALNEERKIETVELKDNQIIHRLDVESAVVKPNPVLPHTVSIKPENIEFTVNNSDTTRADTIAEMRRILLNNSTNENVPSYVDFGRLPLAGSAAMGGSMMRVMGVDGGDRFWNDDTESGSSDTPFRVKIGVDGGGITH